MLAVMVLSRVVVDAWTLPKPSSVPGSFRNRIIDIALCATNPNSVPSLEQQDETAVLEVCLSPGCLADGAEKVLLKLEALASCGSSSSPTPGSAIVGCEIKEGVCCSLCGNGPVAIDASTGKKHRKLSSNQKILDLLLGRDNNTPSAGNDLLEGIDLCLEGEQDLQCNNYKGAIEHCAEGIERGTNAAIALGGAYTDDEAKVPSPRWVVDAHCNEATARLRTGDTERAIASAQNAYNLSQASSAKALEILAEAYQTSGQEVEELESLEALFVLYELQQQKATTPKARRRNRSNRMEENNRRTLGFRLAKLQATLNT